MTSMPREMIEEVDRLAAMPRWSVRDLRPETREALAAMPPEAVQCALAMSRASSRVSDPAAIVITHRARVVLACHDHGDAFPFVGSASSAPPELVLR